MASTIDKSIEFLQSHAEIALSKASAVVGRIGSYSARHTEIGFNFTPIKPHIAPPPAFGDMLPTDTSAANIRFLTEEAEKWVEKYFPEISGALKSSPEEWLAGIITGQDPYGMSKEVFDAIWHEGRDRAYRTASSEQATIRQDFSRRGFTLPPGAMVAAMNSAEIRASDAIAEVNKQQTQRSAEIKLDLLKFAEEQAIRLKVGVMGELASFYGQWIDLMKSDTDIAMAKSRAYAALSSALSSYYNVELGFEELRFKAAAAQMEANVQSNKSFIEEGQVRAAQNTALANATRAFGDVSAAAANAQSSLQADIFSGSA